MNIQKIDRRRRNKKRDFTIKDREKQSVRGGSLIFRTLFSIDVQQIFLEFSHFHSLLSVCSISQLLALKKKCK